jgi:hypothetical protein
MNRLWIKSLLIIACLGVSQGVFAGSGAIEERIMFCSSVGDDSQKLACFEAIADSLREPSADPTPSVQVVSEKTKQKQEVKAAPSPSPRESFGKPKRREKVDEVSAVIDEVQYDGRGRAYVRLDSGQIWVQLESERVTLAVGDRVAIKRGAFGAYFLQPDGSNKRIKVRRRD